MDTKNKKNLNYYLSLNWSYTIEQDVHKGKKFYIIRVNELPGVCTDAPTVEKGMKDIKEAIAGAIELYMEQGDLEGALGYIDDAISLDPHCLYSLSQKFQILNATHRYKEALAIACYCHDICNSKLYRNNPKNQFLAASALPQNFDSHSRLASRQWSFAPNQNFEEPPCQIPDSSGCFGISAAESDPSSVSDRVELQNLKKQWLQAIESLFFLNLTLEAPDEDASFNS